MNGLNQELIGIDTYIDEISEKIEPDIDEVFDDYGLKCVKFSLAAIDIDITKYDTIDASQIEYIARQRGYMSDKAGIEILGTDWGRIQGASILRSRKYAQALGALLLRVQEWAWGLEPQEHSELLHSKFSHQHTMVLLRNRPHNPISNQHLVVSQRNK